ncbi:acyl carrier protein [Castellaniella hirudinis]|uniref:Acyl carrier protein n=1 Tax=Castellaniella hirudinis TaxID=1144617 RepID=A0ABV8S2E4_9BURK
MEDKLFNEVRRAFAAAFNTDPASISMQSEPGDIAGWDSMGHVQLVAELEKIFSVSLEVDEVMEMEDVASIVRVLEAKGL